MRTELRNGIRDGAAEKCKISRHVLNTMKILCNYYFHLYELARDDNVPSVYSKRVSVAKLHELLINVSTNDIWEDHNNLLCKRSASLVFYINTQTKKRHVL